MKKRKQKPKLLDGLKFELETSVLGKSWTKVARGLKSRKVSKQKSKAKSSKWKKSLAEGNGNLFGVMLLGVIVFFVALIAAYPIYKYYTLDIKPSQLDKGFDRPKILDERLNILVGAYEITKGYSFLDFVGVLSVDRNTNRIRLIMVNVDFSLRSKQGGYIELRKTLARSGLVGSSPLDDLSDNVANILGVQIDRYITIKSPDLIQIFDDLGINHVASVDLEDKDLGKVAKGDELTGSRLAEYLASESGGSNQKMFRIVNFLESVSARKNDPLLLLKTLWNLEKVTSSIETNLDRSELLQISNVIWDTEDFDATYVDLLDTSRIDIDGNVYFVPNNNKIDEEIKKIFVIPEVVREQVRVEIYNATGENGFAVKYRRWLENLGGNGVRAATYPDILDETLLYNADRSYWNNVGLINRITRGEAEELNEVYPFNHSGELVLVLGRDLLEE